MAQNLNKPLDSKLFRNYLVTNYYIRKEASIFQYVEFKHTVMQNFHLKDFLLTVLYIILCAHKILFLCFKERD